MPSNWTAAFTRPEPLDPNDRIRQLTQRRAGTFPYDKPVSYGASSHAGMDGDERQDGADDGPPLPRHARYPRPASVWDKLTDSIDNLENGPQAANATELGYGLHGRMGEDGMDAIELDLDANQNDFRASYDSACAVTNRMSSPSLFALLTELDPEFAAETFAPEDEEDMRNIYGKWADRMSGHGE